MPLASRNRAVSPYDAANRVAVVNGRLSGGNIVLAQDATSYSLAYDGDGNAVTRTFLSDGTQVSANGTLSAVGDVLAQMSVYDVNGNLIRTNYALDVTQGDTNNGVQETRSYDANERELTDNQFFEAGTKRSYTDPETHNPVTANIGGWLESATGDSYDQAGHLTMEQNFGRGSGNWVQSIDQYTVSYLKKDGYLEAATSGTSNTQNVHPATDESVYDERGERIALTQHVANAEGVVNDTVRVFAYNGEGEILTRRDGELDGNGVFTQSDPASQSQHYTYVEGAQVASEDEAGTLNVLDAVTAFSNSDTGTQGYVVQAGDTLQGIAQAVYGGASLWYVIADANGLQSDSDLVAGQTLTVPQVRTNSNTATTFKPYDPNQITGSTTPTLPSIIPPPPHHHHCSGLAQIIVIAVVIVVSIYTAGLAAEAYGAAAGATFSTGASVLGGTAVAGVSAGEGIAAAAIGGFAGNAAGQLVGDALGVHQGFSLDEALAGGLTAGATAGLGEVLAGSSTFGETTANGGRAVNTAGDYVLGAGAYAANVAADNLTGQPEQFSWASLVAASLSSGVTNQIGLKGTSDLVRRTGTWKPRPAAPATPRTCIRPRMRACTTNAASASR